LSIVARRDGIVQWTHAGAPLFTYANDLKPTDVNGRGVDARFRLALVERAFMPADVIVHRSAELGDLLATTGGATLYQHDRVTPFEGHDFRSDRGPPSLGRLLGTASCDARCTQTWLPLAAPAEAVACGDWDVLLRADGTRQWAYKGFALYTYAPDPPGGITGNGIYELATLGDDAGNGPGTTRVPAGSSVAGIGVGAMFWHAVVP
jgi:predicted lipoprotein with Yx(FWY)xxD motif